NMDEYEDIKNNRKGSNHEIDNLNENSRDLFEPEKEEDEDEEEKPKINPTKVRSKKNKTQGETMEKEEDKPKIVPSKVILKKKTTNEEKSNEDNLTKNKTGKEDEEIKRNLLNYSDEERENYSKEENEEKPKEEKKEEKVRNIYTKEDDTENIPKLNFDEINGVKRNILIGDSEEKEKEEETNKDKEKEKEEENKKSEEDEVRDFERFSDEEDNEKEKSQEKREILSDFERFSGEEENPIEIKDAKNTKVILTNEDEDSQKKKNNQLDSEELIKNKNNGESIENQNNSEEEQNAYYYRTNEKKDDSNKPKAEDKNIKPHSLFSDDFLKKNPADSEENQRYNDNSNEEKSEEFGEKTRANKKKEISIDFEKSNEIQRSSDEPNLDEDKGKNKINPGESQDIVNHRITAPEINYGKLAEEIRKTKKIEEEEKSEKSGSKGKNVLDALRNLEYSEEKDIPSKRYTNIDHSIRMSGIGGFRKTYLNRMTKNSNRDQVILRENREGAVRDPLNLGIN
ncbi:MAG: hypothetical protein MJ252_11815, partial [archaeon]|nr:hypothetical protein [archaeon]